MADEEDEEDERPWDEPQWEAFMKESDVRAARFGELFETLIDDPDRDEKIAEEMGWNREDQNETGEDRARSSSRSWPTQRGRWRRQPPGERRSRMTRMTSIRSRRTPGPWRRRRRSSTS
jgi:hypothetical protein